MAWDSRDYYRGRESGAEYLGNPALFFSFSAPFGRWFGVPVRLSFWLLLSLLLHYISVAHGTSFVDATINAALFIAMLLVHDFGHRIMASRVGGTLDEFMLWPAGGLNHPTAPPDPTAALIAHSGGVVANLLVGLAALAGVYLCHAQTLLQSLPAQLLISIYAPVPAIPLTDVLSSVGVFLVTLVIINALLVVVNLLPFYWFDGGYIWEAILRRWTGAGTATVVTCVAGMVLAVPMLALSLYLRDLFTMIMWVLLFASAFNKRREAAAGQVFDFSAPYGAAYGSEPSARRKPRWPTRNLVQAAAKARKEQEKIDGILAKVHASGMQSLNFFERRSLQQATERQRRKSAEL